MPAHRMRARAVVFGRLWIWRLRGEAPRLGVVGMEGNLTIRRVGSKKLEKYYLQ